eukprot:963143-Alexandrium_andersonii.AAC.1
MFSRPLLSSISGGVAIVVCPSSGNKVSLVWPSRVLQGHMDGAVWWVLCVGCCVWGAGWSVLQFVTGGVLCVGCWVLCVEC